MNNEHAVARAALISFGSAGMFGTPTVVVFQYNPVELSRSLQQKRSPGCGSGEPSQAEAFRVDGPPTETITLKAEFDSDDAIMDGEFAVSLVGVRPALASLEMLLYPQDSTGLGAVAGAIASGLGGALQGGATYSIPPQELPVVLFVWGPGRILPVRLTALAVREQEFDLLLNPIRAEVDITVEVLKRLPSDHPAYGVWQYTEKQMRIVAGAQIVNNAQAILSGLPIF
jgi:hypothetical protein